MSEERTYQQVVNERIRKEQDEFDNPQVKNQLVLDFHWELEVERRALARRTEIPERGVYDEMKRFEQEVRDN